MDRELSQIIGQIVDVLQGNRGTQNSIEKLASSINSYAHGQRFKQELIQCTGAQPDNHPLPIVNALISSEIDPTCPRFAKNTDYGMCMKGETSLGKCPYKPYS